MNYRDLQNISNLSQEILIEGANEEHNVLNRWPYTSPYLQESYMDVYGLDEKIATPPSRYDTRKELDAKSRRLRRSSDFYTYGGENQDPDERTISTSKGEGGITKNPKKLRKQKAMGEFGEQVDLYDIILSHLLDEGYAETQEQAEVIMVNMSEEWRESICEEYKKLPVGKMIKQASNKTIDSLEYHDGSKEPPRGQDSRTAANRQGDHIGKMGEVADTHNPAKSKRKEDDNRRTGGRKRDAGRLLMFKKV